jgi:hypothetical protein
VRKPVTGVTGRDGRQGIAPGRLKALSCPGRPGAERRLHFTPPQLAEDFAGETGEEGRNRHAIIDIGRCKSTGVEISDIIILSTLLKIERTSSKLRRRGMRNLVLLPCLSA